MSPKRLLGYALAAFGTLGILSGAERILPGLDFVIGGALLVVCGCVLMGRD